MKKAINSLCITALVLAVMGVVDQKESLAQTSPITGYIGDLSDLILDLVLSDGVRLGDGADRTISRRHSERR